MTVARAEFKFDCDSDIMGLMKYRKDLFHLLLLFLFSMIFWGPALAPGKLLFLRDLSIEIIPKRHFMVNSGGFALWSPFMFFGAPFAANLQSAALYPLNVIFLIFGAERGLVYFLFLHHLLFVLTSYLAFRALKFSAGAGLVGAVGLGFGGFLVSLSVLAVVLSTVSWAPLIIILLKKAVDGRWLLFSLLLGLVLAMQALSAEAEFAALGAFLAVAAVAASPGFKMETESIFRLSGAVAFGLVWCLLLSLPQIALTLQLIPISNRGAGMALSEALNWSLSFSQLKSLVVPNYLLPLSSGKYWGLGFFSDYSYLLSFYLGAALLPAAGFSVFKRPGARVSFGRRVREWLGRGR
jgi:hypothetical protein